MITDGASCSSLIPFALVIPTRNAGSFAQVQIEAVRRQSHQPIALIVIDSASNDETPDLYREAGFEVRSISAETFDHGGTRNLGWRACKAEVVLYLTQDSIPVGEDCFTAMCAPFADPMVGVVNGRQLARPSAGAIEHHSRLYSYPEQGNKRSWPEARSLGYRAIFNSNACAAYRRSTLDSFGGFPEHIIFGEDQVAAARALLNGWSLVYAADARVQHSHGYTVAQEFRRYFDVGVFYEQNRLLLASFPKLSGEGRRFAQSELRFLMQHAPHQIPQALLRSIMKLLGYKLGRGERRLPISAKRRLAMNSRFAFQEL